MGVRIYPSGLTMQRYVGILAFVGTKFQGWQTQKQGQSVQEHVEKVWSQLLNEPIKVYGASRTDAGVHARGFVFHFDTKQSRTSPSLQHSFNRLIDTDIYLKQLRKVPSTFEARYQHSKKTYTYQILCGERDPFLAPTVMYVPMDLNEKKLKQAMRLFLGQHDFRSFTTKKEDGANFVRNIFRFQLKRVGHLFTFTIVGDGFMTYMVRMIIGTLVAYAQDKLTLESIAAYLDNKDKGRVSYKAEPQGLCLEKVQYASKT